MPTVRSALSCALLALAMAQAPAAMTLASPFADHAVLQRERPVPVWGQDNPGGTVTVICQGIIAQAVTGADGHWRATLAPLPTGGPYELTVKGSATIVLQDILVGDVWLCSGQSNMCVMVKNSLNSEAETAQGDHPRLRAFKVAAVASNTPQTTCGGKWDVCSRSTVAGFGAVGYFFGRELQRTLDVPIGLINSALGSTAAESWTNPTVLAASSEFRDSRPMPKTAPRAPATAKPPPTEMDPFAQGAGDKGVPGSLYNGMIAPLVPYALRGAIWYQGESNTSDAVRTESYRRLLPLMVNGWRQDFGQEFPFYIVQLAGFARRDPPSSEPWHVSLWSVLRESQAVAAKTLSQSGLAVAIDIGDANAIHPRNKQEVGHRLALIALAQEYGQAVECSGPVFKAMTIAGNTATIDFDHAQGLATKDGGTLTGFVIAGEDGRFQPAQATIAGTTVHVSSAVVAKPAAVRYAWAGFPACNLVNGANLPAAPFRFPMK